MDKPEQPTSKQAQATGTAQQCFEESQEWARRCAHAQAELAAMTKLYSELGEKHEAALLDVQKWQTLNRHAIEDSCDDDTKIRDLCRPHLKPLECDGDSLVVPTIVNVVESTRKNLERETERLAEFVHLQESEDRKPTLADFRESQRDVIKLANELDQARDENEQLQIKLERTVFERNDAVANLVDERDKVRADLAATKLSLNNTVMELFQSRNDLTAMTKLYSDLGSKHELSLAAVNALQQRVKEAARIIQACLNTGGIRTDDTRQIWDDANAFLEPINAGGGA
jgi:ribosomal protein L20A (L18A)